MHYIYACTHIYACQFLNSTIMCSAVAMQAARNSASGWGRTSSSCLCSCAPLHHAGSQPCYAMLQNVLQTICKAFMQYCYRCCMQLTSATAILPTSDPVAQMVGVSQHYAASKYILYYFSFP